MMKILTITLNPAFDLHYYVDIYRPYRESYAKDFECNVGGKGINISRALLVGNIESILGFSCQRIPEGNCMNLFFH